MLTLLDEFCGLGGSTEGASRVPGVEPAFAANHSQQAIESHAQNHPSAEHWLGDVQKINVGDVFPRCDIFWSSPACPAWSDARGRRRTFDTSNQLALWAEELSEEQQTAIRSRALMEEVVLYLRACHGRGKPVLAGVVENVIQCRLWGDWDRWINEIRALGYQVRVIALNSMHAKAPASPPCPQSRDRLYVAYWREHLGRAPDWDKWLRPRAWCPTCGWVHALQVFKNPRQDMGRYGAQYTFRCPSRGCHLRVEPDVLPAAAAIDWRDPGERIADRSRPLASKTLDRIRAGMAKYGRPITLEAAGHTFERRPGVRTRPADAPLTTQTTTPTKAVACPPLLVPAGGTWRDDAMPADSPMPARTTRETDGLAVPPSALLVPYYGNGRARPATGPVGTLSTRDRYAIATDPGALALADVRFRMLEPAEIQAAMAFPKQYRVLPPAKRDRVRLLGNAVTPTTAEVIVSALTEAITAEELPR